MLRRGGLIENEGGGLISLYSAGLYENEGGGYKKNPSSYRGGTCRR